MSAIATVDRSSTQVQPWTTVQQEVAAAFGMGGEETSRFVRHWVSRLIAALPFLAGAERPHRTAAIHLSTYLLSVRRTRYLFQPTPDDDHDVFARLAPIASFEGGDKRIIERGLAMLALNMVVDYQRDVHLDVAVGKHNPVAEGAWDPDRLITDLQATISAVRCPEMDEIVGEDWPEGLWLYG